MQLQFNHHSTMIGRPCTDYQVSHRRRFAHDTGLSHIEAVFAYIYQINTVVYFGVAPKTFYRCPCVARAVLYVGIYLPVGIFESAIDEQRGSRPINREGQQRVAPRIDGLFRPIEAAWFIEIAHQDGRAMRMRGNIVQHGLYLVEAASTG